MTILLKSGLPSEKVGLVAFRPVTSNRPMLEITYHAPS